MKPGDWISLLAIYVKNKMFTLQTFANKTLILTLDLIAMYLNYICWSRLARKERRNGRSLFFWQQIRFRPHCEEMKQKSVIFLILFFFKTYTLKLKEPNKSKINLLTIWLIQAVKGSIFCGAGKWSNPSRIGHVLGGTKRTWSNSPI